MVRTARRRVDRKEQSDYHRRPTGHDEDEREEENLEEAREELRKSEERYLAALRVKYPDKDLPKDDLKNAGKIFLKGAGKFVNGFFDANMQIGKSVERDIYQHSLQKKINDTAIDALLKRNTSRTASTKRRTIRPRELIEVIDERTGRIALVEKKNYTRTTRRRS